MVSLTHRNPLIRQYQDHLSLTLLIKGGLGIVIPHPENTIFGHQSDVGPKNLGNALGVSSGWWQLKGWTIGLETGLRLALYQPFFIEIADKLAFSKMYGIPVYKGSATQSIWMNEWLFLLGGSFQLGRTPQSRS